MPGKGTHNQIKFIHLQSSRKTYRNKESDFPGSAYDNETMGHGTPSRGRIDDNSASNFRMS